jgi:hypothetical protein
MKKIEYIIVLTFLIISCAHAQDNQSYKVCVEEFYKLLFSNRKVTINDFSKVYSNSLEASFLTKGSLQNQITYLEAQKEIEAHSDTMKSQTLIRMKVYQEQLIRGLNYESIYKQIELTSVYNEGTEFSSLLELKLTEKDVIYFEINKDTPKQIQYIWLSSGESLGDLVQGNKIIEKLKRPGIINDAHGYTNIRDKPDKGSQITAKLIKNEIFYYTPNESDWWSVYKEEGGKQVGYIHKSRILKYTDFTPKQKEKVKKQRGGC